MKKTLITLAALAVASVASAATYSYDSEDFSNGVLTLDTTLAFNKTTSWTLTAEIVIGSTDYNMWGTPALVTGGNATANDVPLKLYLRNNDGNVWTEGVGYVANPNDTNKEKKLNTVFFGSDNDSNYFTGLQPGAVLTLSWDYDATKTSEQFTASYKLLQNGQNLSDGLAAKSITDAEADKTFSQLSSVVLGMEGWAINEVTVTTAAIPEPTTATLSLLALAGLAARRRRK